MYGELGGGLGMHEARVSFCMWQAVNRSTYNDIKRVL